MGLLDRKRKPPAEAAAKPAGPADSVFGPLSGNDADSLRDMLIAAAAARDNKLLASLATANRATIAANFRQWQRVPESVRTNESAVQRYANTLIALAELFRDQFNDASLAQLLSGPTPNSTVAQWERGLAHADGLLKEFKYDEARQLLTQILAAIEDVPKDGPVPIHAVTHGRLAHVLFSMGEAEGAAEQMAIALAMSEQRGEEQGIAAALRGMYEVNRYRGNSAAAADFAEKMAAQFGRLGVANEQQWWLKQAQRVRAGEPLCRVVFFVNDQQCEVDEMPAMTESGRLRYGFVRNRPSVGWCEAFVQQGMQAGSQAKFEEALGFFRSGMKVDPYDPTPHFQAAVTLMHLQRAAEAVEEYDITERLAPGWFNGRSERWIAGEIAAGRADFPVFFVLRTEEMPDDAATWDQKLDLVDKSIAGSGEMAPLLLYRGRCLLRLGRINEATTTLRRGLEIAQEPDVKTRLLVDLNMVANDPEERRRLLVQAAEINGNLAAAAVARITLRQMK